MVGNEEEFFGGSIDLQSVLLLELKVLLVEGVDAIDHGLDELNLRVTKTVLVGDIVSGTW